MSSTRMVIKDFNDLQLPPHVRAVLMDFDNTFYKYQPCHEYALEEVKKHLESSYGVIENFYQLYQSAQEIIKSSIPNHGASHSRILYFQTLLTRLGSTNIIRESLELETMYWNAFKEKMTPTAGVLDFLAECRKSGKKVVIVSDLTTRIQFQKMVTLGVADLIFQVVTSEEAGAEKPDPAPFRLALEKLGLTAADVIMIGDSLDKDVAGAETFGIPAILITHETAA